MRDYNPFRLDAGLSVPLPGIGTKPARHAIEKLLGLDKMARAYQALPPSDTPEAFADNILNHFRISHKIVSGGLSSIPATGPILIVANHPFGGIEGILLLTLLLKRRADVKIMANSLLERIPELSTSFIGVNPYATHTATRQNFSAMRGAVDWLKTQGLLLVFPAGDVASMQLPHKRIAEGKWDASIARLARMSSAQIVPLYVEGKNSLGFHLLGNIHPRIRTVLLPREVLNKTGRRIRLWIDGPISIRRLSRIGSDCEIAHYLRLRTCMLPGRNPPGPAVTEYSDPPPNARLAAINPARPKSILCNEISLLPAEQKLVVNKHMDVFYAHAAQIPDLLREIGRMREITFRANGEGTGKSTDIDCYDSNYLHLFIWNRLQQEIVGAYRMGLSDKIMQAHGVKGFYSHSLFSFNNTLPEKLNPAIELGRSFVCKKYQKNMLPMMLLWKGIGAFVVRHPQYATLFGPVSISNEYSALSHQLMIEYFNINNPDAPLKKHIKPRNRYHSLQNSYWRKNDLAGLTSIEALSALVSSLESDGKGVPVLIRHYVNFGGRMLGFNVDDKFANCIDGLVVVDLRKAPKRTLNRYMGRDGAAGFQAYHEKRQ